MLFPPTLHSAGVVILLGLICPYVARGVLPADAGEFQLVARDLGVAHPPGYPLYTLAAHGFGRLVVALTGLVSSAWSQQNIAGVGDDTWAWAVSLFSALLAAVTLWLVFQIARGLTKTLSGGVLAAAILAFSPTFITQATTANIRMPTALFTAALVLLALKLLDSTDSDGGQAVPQQARLRAALLVLLLGLAVGHHISLVLLGLPIVALLLYRRTDLVRDRKTWALGLAALGAAFVPLLYLPVRDRAGAVLAPGGLTTLPGLVAHVTAYGFRGDMLYFGDAAALADRARVLVNIFVIQFGYLGLAAAIGGTVLLLRSRPAAAALLLVSAALISVAAVTYRAPQTVEYLMPVYVMVAVLAGGAAGTGGASSHARRWGRVAVAFIIVTAIAVGRRNLPALVRDSHPRLRAVSSVLGRDCAPAGATILASWHYAPPLWYAARHIEPRADLRIVYVSPAGAERPGETWRRRVEALSGPVIVTNRYPELAQAARDHAEQGAAQRGPTDTNGTWDGSLWPVRDTPFYATQPAVCPAVPDAGARASGGAAVSSAPTNGAAAGGAPEHGAAASRTAPSSTAPSRTVARADFGGTVRLLSATLSDSQARGPAVVAHFTPLRRLEEDLTIVAQLVDPVSGSVWGQMDHGYSAARWNHAAGIVDALPLVPFRGALPRRLVATVGVYRNTSSGPERLKTLQGDAIVVGELAGGDLTRLAKPKAAPGAIPFGAAMSLVGVSVRTTDARANGQQVVVDLDWLAEEALVTDYAVSVQVHGAGWRAQHDGIPAQGAIPTLKWLPGMRVTDRHRVALPTGLRSPNAYRVTVAVYDASTMEPLPITDGELVRRGQGQYAEVYCQPSPCGAAR